MTKRVIYLGDAGNLNIIVPSPEALSIYGIGAIALKDVPSGKPFKIVDTSDIPSDRIFREAWTIDEAALTDGIGANFSSFDDVAEDVLLPGSVVTLTEEAK